MPITLDNSRAFTDFRSSRRINQDLIDKCQGQPVGICLSQNTYKELPKDGDKLLITTISTYDVPYYTRR